MMFTPLRKAVIAGGSVLALGAAGGVAVHAAVSGGSTNAALTATTASPTPSPSGSAKDHSKTCAPAGAMGMVHQVLSIAEKDTGLTEQQILDQLRAGKTFDEIAGSKAQTVENDLLAALKTRLDKAVSNGKLTSDRETTMLDKAKTAIEKAMSSNLSSRIPASGNLQPCAGGRHGDAFGGKVFKTLISVTAQQTGLTEEQVRQDLRNGQSIDQIAGHEAAAIKAAVLAQLQKDFSSELDKIMSHNGGWMGGHGFHGAAGTASPSPGA